MVKINGLDGTAGQVPTLLPSACCQLRSVRKYRAGREGSASHGCLEMIDIFMVKLGFLGSSIPPRGRFLGSGLHARVRRSAAHGHSATCQGPACTPTSYPCTRSWVQAPTEAMHSSMHGSTAPAPSPLSTSVSEPAGWLGWTLKTSKFESKSREAPKAQVTHGSLSTSMARDPRARCLQGAGSCHLPAHGAVGSGDWPWERALVKEAAETTCCFLNRR